MKGNEILLLGLGTEPSDVSAAGFLEIQNAKKVIVRTEKAISSLALKELVSPVYLDDIYEKSRSFGTLNKNLAKAVITAAKECPVVYAVDGSVTEDESCREIIKRYKNVRIIPGVSAVTKTLEKLKTVETKVCAYSAYDFNENSRFFLPLVVYAIDDKYSAANVKLVLSDLIGEETDVKVTFNGGTKDIKLYELDRLPYYSYDFSLYVPEIPLKEKKRFDFGDIIDVMKILRSERGCPWDRAQTPSSIEKNTIEEVYELYDAVKKDDTDGIVEELGDVLMQVAFHINFGLENGRYTPSDVFSGICEKLITRHTHVFGSDDAENSEDALSLWNKNKAIEKGYKNGAEYLDSVPKGLPAVMRAQKLGARAAKYNFDFCGVNEAYAKIAEETEEVKKAAAGGNENALNEEVGDLLFSAVNLARLLGVDGETALYAAAEKFKTRFTKTEELIAKDGKDIKNLSERETDEYYKRVKESENKKR